MTFTGIDQRRDQSSERVHQMSKASLDKRQFDPNYGIKLQN